MNKQELIEKYKDKYPTISMDSENYGIFQELWKDIKQLDEPQKPVVPQFIAEFITEQKKLGHTLSYSIDACMSDRVAEWYWDNSELFATAWINGYDIEEVKRYLVKMKGLRESTSYLNYDSIDAEWYFADAENGPAVGTHCTRKELESAGFGWVFDCPGIEVEEVEE